MIWVKCVVNKRFRGVDNSIDCEKNRLAMLSI